MFRRLRVSTHVDKLLELIHWMHFAFFVCFAFTSKKISRVYQRKNTRDR